MYTKGIMKYLSKLDLKPLKGKTALVRIDLDIEKAEMHSNARIEAAIPTIQLLLKNQIRVIFLSHRGRPSQAKKKTVSKKSDFSLSLFTPIFKKRLNRTVDFISASQIGVIKKLVQKSSARVILLENLRFFEGEEKNDPSFAKALATLGDLYVNEAFAVSHRENASVCAITKYLQSYAGLHLEKEVKTLEKVMKTPKHPITLLIGGIKIADKIKVIEYFKKKADAILVSGGVANTFLMAQGLPIGDSVTDTKYIPFAKANLKNPNIFFPKDVKIFKRKILDIGPRTIKEFGDVLKKSNTIIWGGPVGLYSKKGFENGQEEMWKAIFQNKKATIVVGGGETLGSLSLFKNRARKYKKNKNLFLSTGGGAMLKYLSGKKLPGIEALK